MIKDCILEKSGWPEPVSMRVLLSVLYPVLSLTIFGLYPSMVSLIFLTLVPLQSEDVVFRALAC